MWYDHENLTPEERLDRIAEILAEGVLRLIERKKRKGNKSCLKVNKTNLNPPISDGKIPSERT